LIIGQNKPLLVCLSCLTKPFSELIFRTLHGSRPNNIQRLLNMLSNLSHITANTNTEEESSEVEIISFFEEIPTQSTLNPNNLVLTTSSTATTSSTTTTSSITTTTTTTQTSTTMSTMPSTSSLSTTPVDDTNMNDISNELNLNEKVIIQLIQSLPLLYSRFQGGSTNFNQEGRNPTDYYSESSRGGGGLQTGNHVESLSATGLHRFREQQDHIILPVPVSREDVESKTINEEETILVEAMKAPTPTNDDDLEENTTVNSVLTDILENSNMVDQFGLPTIKVLDSDILGVPSIDPVDPYGVLNIEQSGTFGVPNIAPVDLNGVLNIAQPGTFGVPDSSPDYTTSLRLRSVVTLLDILLNSKGCVTISVNG